MLGLHVARVHCFLSFVDRHGALYPCALIHWFTRTDEDPDEDTGMWIVEPESTEEGDQNISVVHLDTILRAAHLIPVYGEEFIGKTDFRDTLDTFDRFYVNKFADHHANEIAF